MHRTETDETRPLLAHDADADAEHQRATPAPTPLPRVQLAVLCVLRVLDPLLFTQIFPYVNEFTAVLRGTADPAQIAFYSGMLESAFAVTQLCAIYPWAWASDAMGRRPMILAGTAGLAAATLAFGLQGTFAGALTTRALAGLFSGNVAVLPAVLCEITDASNQAAAFPIFGLFWPLGAILGPLVGGTLAYAADKFPALAGYAFLRTHPYFLPCFVAAAVAAIGTAFGWLFLEETLPAKCTSTPADDPISYASTSSAGGDSVAPPSPATVRTLLASPVMRTLCTSSCSLSFISTAFDVVFVLFCYSPVRAGGLAFSAAQIGYALATAGAIAALLQATLMPRLLRACDHARLYARCGWAWPGAFTVLPALNFAARAAAAGAISPARAQAVVWPGIALALALSRVGNLSYSVHMLLVKAHTPRAALGAAHGLVQFAICAARAGAPFIASAMFAVSVERGQLGGHLWAVAMVGVSLGGCVLAHSVVAASGKCQDAR